MYYIDDYRQQAINKIIPYLIEFPEIVSIIENSADRYQAIEDVLWRIANNFKVINSRGVFLNAHAHNEVVDLVYTDKAKDAFTYGTEFPDTQAFGTGHFYSQASYLSGISKDVSEDKLIRAVQEKIIQNNTNGTIQDFIEAMKLHFNATSVNIYESYPLAISLMLSGEKLELSSSGNKEAIKKCLPACVSLNNLYINDHLFDQFTYSDKSGYANDSRYPITLGDSDYLYKYISTAVNLNSNNKEYIKINSPFYNINFPQNEIPFECICGQLTKLNNNGVIYSFIYNSTNIYKISLITTQIESEYYFVLSRAMWNNTNSTWQNISTFNTNIKAELNKDYTFLLSTNHDSFDFFRVWIFDSIKLIGQNSLQDTSWVYNTIQNNINFTQIQLNTTNISYDEQNIINAEIVNYNNKNINNYSDFTYYCILGGVLNAESNIDINNESSHYYITCFGEKNILFNCLSNNNHIVIKTNNTLQNNLTTKQSSYNYKKWHSNGKYLNIYNKNNQPSIRWNSQQSIDSLVNSFDLSFDLCLLINSTSTFDRSKFTIVGSPTITEDGIASGFTSRTNYITGSFTSVSATNKVELWGAIINNTTDTNGSVICATNGNLRITKQSANVIGIRGLAGGLTLNSPNLHLQDGDFVIAHAIVTTTDATLQTWINGVKQTDVTVSGDFSAVATSYDSLYIGGQYNNGNYSPASSIDMKYCKVVIDGVEVFNGTKTVLRRMEEAFDLSKFTVVGTPNITDDGIASGFSNNNRVYSSYNITPNKKIEVKTIFKFTETPSVTFNGISGLYDSINGYCVSLGYSKDTGKFYVGTVSTMATAITTTVPLVIDSEYQIVYGVDFENKYIYVSSVLKDGVEQLSSIKTNTFNKTVDITGSQFIQCIGYVPTQTMNYMSGGGIIDLKQSSTIVDDKEVFDGSNLTANILNGLLGSNTKFNISYNTEQQKLIIVLPTYTSGNVEVPYIIEVNLSNEEFIKKFNNLRIKYTDNKIYIYINDTVIKSENILDVNVRYINAILELGPINAFVKDLVLNCVYTDGVNVSNLEYNLPLVDSLYEKNNLIQPVNYNARFLTTPQLIDNTTNQDLFNNETLRIVNF